MLGWEYIFRLGDHAVAISVLEHLEIPPPSPQSQLNQICRSVLRHQYFLKFSRLSQNTAKLEKQVPMPSACKGGEAEGMEKTQALHQPDSQSQVCSLWKQNPRHRLPKLTHACWHVSCLLLTLPGGQNVPTSDFLSKPTEYT